MTILANTRKFKEAMFLKVLIYLIYLVKQVLEFLI